MNSVPSVTEIIYSLGLAEGSPFFQPKHRRRGRLVHDAALLLAHQGSIPEEWWSMTSGDPENPRDSVSHEECREHLKAFDRWMVATRWHLDRTLHRNGQEVELRHRNGTYVGHADQIGFMGPNARHWIVDLKCGEPEKWHRLQTSFYWDALVSQHRIVARRACLYLPSGKLVEHTDSTDLLVARAALTLYQWRGG